MKLVTTLTYVNLYKVPNGPRNKKDFSTRTEYERPFEFIISTKDQSKVWTLHNVKFLGPFLPFILTSTGDGFKDPLEAALYVDSLLSGQMQEAAE